MRNKRIIIAASITATLLVIVSVAFAALSSTLNISFGNVTQNALTWNVGFKGSSVTPVQEGTSDTGLACGTATVTSSTVTISDSTLSKPGDKCTYPLTVENKGDISANLDAITMSQPSNMNCTIKDESTMICGNITIKLYTKSGTDFSSGVTIQPKEEYNLSLVISYTGDSLNSSSLTINSSSIVFTYKQASNRIGSVLPDGITEVLDPICKRATSLHTETCSRSDTYGCSRYPYTTRLVGNLGTAGVLTPGDAFDCDVNGDGTYDAATERFYYISGLDGDNTSDYAVLLYYTNVSGGNPVNKSSFYYNLSGYNYKGPVTAYLQLPTTSQWSNVSLSNNTRQIYSEKGTTSTTGGSLPVFTYVDRAARMLSYKEVNKACGITIGSKVDKELDNCRFLMEHTNYWSVGTNGYNYWLETPYSGTSNGVWYIRTDNLRADVDSTSSYANAVRPVIEVLKTDIEY